MGLAMLFIAGLLAMGWAARVADEKGRSPIGWAFVSSFVGAVGFLVGTVALRVVSDGDDSGNRTLIVAVVPLALPFLTMFGIVVLVHRLPTVAAAPTTAKWPVHRIGTSEEGHLHVLTEALRLETNVPPVLVVPLADLTRVDVDGECLKLRWRHGDAEEELVLLPTGKPDTREGRVAQSTALAKRVQGLRGRAD